MVGGGELRCFMIAGLEGRSGRFVVFRLGVLVTAAVVELIWNGVCCTDCAFATWIVDWQLVLGLVRMRSSNGLRSVAQVAY